MTNRYSVRVSRSRLHGIVKMLEISQVQMQDLARRRLPALAERLLPIVEQSYPEQVMLEDPLKVRERLSNLVQTAWRLDFKNEKEVALFVVYCMELGDDFLQRPDCSEVTDILVDVRMEPLKRLSRAGELIFLT